MKKAYQDEIAGSLTGDSAFSPEQLTAAIRNVEEKTLNAKMQIEEITNEMNGKKAAMENLRPQFERFRTWAVEFDDSTLQQKKMIISQLIKRIELGKGYKINVQLNMDYKQFCEDWDTVRLADEVGL